MTERVEKPPSAASSQVPAVGPRRTQSSVRRFLARRCKTLNCVLRTRLWQPRPILSTPHRDFVSTLPPSEVYVTACRTGSYVVRSANIATKDPAAYAVRSTELRVRTSLTSRRLSSDRGTKPGACAEIGTSYCESGPRASTPIDGRLTARWPANCTMPRPSALAPPGSSLGRASVGADSNH